MDDSKAVGIIRADSLSEMEGVVHGFLNRNCGGSLKDVALIHGLRCIRTLMQVHGCRVCVIEGCTVPSAYENAGDGILTARGAVGVGIYTADCVPVLLYEPRSGAVGAVHVGWRGALQGVVASALECLDGELGARPRDVVAAIGPSIGSCCYEVGLDVAGRFMEYRPDSGSFLRDTSGGKFILDLKNAVKGELESCGVEKIEVLGHCTKCSLDFYSYRREGAGVGSQLSFIGLV